MIENKKRKILDIGSQLIERYALFKLNAEFKNLPFYKFYIAVAKCSGPIALLYNKLYRFDKKVYKFPEDYENHILIFSCKGQLKRKIKFELTERIIYFGFTMEENLHMIFSSGKYLLFDIVIGALIRNGEGNYIDSSIGKQAPISAEATDFIKPTEASSQIKASISSLKKQKCLGAEMRGERIFLLKQNKLGVVINSEWRMLNPIKLNFPNQIFTADCMNSEDGEQMMTSIYFLSKEANIERFCLEEAKGGNKETTIVFENSYLKKNANSLICITVKLNQIGLIFESCAIIGSLDSKETSIINFGVEVKIEKEDSYSKSSANSKYRNMYNVGWIGNSLVFCDRSALFVFNKIPQNTSDFYREKLTLSCNFIIFEEQGFRMLEESLYLFREVPDSLYLKLIGQNYWASKMLKQPFFPIIQKSQQSELIQPYELFCQLLNVFEKFTNKEVLSTEQLSISKESACDILKVVLSRVQFCMDVGEQMRMLRFAVFIKNYYGVQEIEVNGLCEELRIVNNLRYESMNRALTLRQFKCFKSNQLAEIFEILPKIGDKNIFLTLLLRHNLHFIADIIFKKSADKERIFFHWAKCKVEKENQLNALDNIKAKYIQMKNDLINSPLFTDLAKYCLERQKINLALKMIQLEKHSGRKIMIALLILIKKRDSSFVEKILDFAEQSRQSTIMINVLLSLEKLSEASDNEWLPSELWMSSLPKKPLLEGVYLRLMRESNRDKQELSDYLIKCKKISEAGYDQLESFFTKKELSFEFNELKETISNQCSKLLPSLSKKIRSCQLKNNIQELRKLKRKPVEITENDTQQFTQEKDFEYLAQIIIQHDQNIPLAVKILKRIKGEHLYELLLRIGKIRDAMQVALERSNKGKLDELIQVARNVKDIDLEEYGKALQIKLFNKNKKLIPE